jgi:hypothetical protein
MAVAATAILVLSLLAGRPLLADEECALNDSQTQAPPAEAPPAEAPPAEPSEEARPPAAEPKPTSIFARTWRAARLEAGRYVADAAGLATAPLAWKAADWKKAGGVTLVLGGLFLADESIDHAIQKNRSHFTDQVSSQTTSFGGGRGPEISVALIVVGTVFQSANVQGMGREAIEAGIFADLIATVVKRAAGRERPFRSNGETDFDVGTRNDSFPSGHATEAFSLASVIAMRSPGWIIPGIAYTAATLVAFDRLNDRVHFPSDVFAGAVLGTVTARWLVARHRREESKGAPEATLDIVPISHGLSARVRF